MLQDLLFHHICLSRQHRCGITSLLSPFAPQKEVRAAVLSQICKSFFKCLRRFQIVGVLAQAIWNPSVESEPND